MGWFFKNDKDRIATRLEFEGSFEHPQTSVWTAVLYLFRNAFVKALPPRLESPGKLEPLKKKVAGP